MMQILQEKFPEAELINLEQPHSPGKTILLYPDSIGLGWNKIENRLKIQTQDITVLNGRKRVFEFTPFVRRMLLLRRFLEMTFLPEMLLLRRFLEMTFLPEILLTPFVLFYGAFVATKDKFRGFKS